MDIEDFTNYLVNHLTDGEYLLTKEQEDKVLNRMKQFSEPSYIKGNNPPYSFKHIKRFNCGSVGVKLDINRGVIRDFILYGDYFTDQDPNLLKSYFINQPFDIKTVEAIIQQFNINDYIVGLTNEEFISLFKEDI